MQALEPWSWLAGIGSLVVALATFVLALYVDVPSLIARRRDAKERAHSRAPVGQELKDILAVARALDELERRGLEIKEGIDPAFLAENLPRKDRFKHLTRLILKPTPVELFWKIAPNTVVSGCLAAAVGILANKYVFGL